MFGKFVVSASFAALLAVAPAIAQEAQGQSQGGGQGSQENQLTLPDQNSDSRAATPNQANEAQQSGQGQANDQGQGTNQQRRKTQQSTDGQPAADEGQARDESSGKADRQNADQGQQGDQDVTTGATGRAERDVTPEQRTVIRERIITRNAPRVERDRVDFDINVGVAVPGTIALQPLPPDIVEIAPAYRGYNYFVLADGTIIIVDPGTQQIVYVLAG